MFSKTFIKFDSNLMKMLVCTRQKVQMDVILSDEIQCRVQFQKLYEIFPSTSVVDTCGRTNSHDLRMISFKAVKERMTMQVNR